MLAISFSFGEVSMPNTVSYKRTHTKRTHASEMAFHSRDGAQPNNRRCSDINMLSTCIKFLLINFAVAPLLPIVDFFSRASTFVCFYRIMKLTILNFRIEMPNLDSIKIIFFYVLFVNRSILMDFSEGLNGLWEDECKCEYIKSVK